MSDEENEEQGYHLFLPPGLLAHIERHEDFHQMRAENAKHLALTFIKNLDEEEIEIFRGILNSVIQNTEYGHFLAGVTLMIRESNFRICPSCGRDHQQIEQELLGSQSDADAPVTPYVLTEQDLSDMEEYNLDDLRDEDTHQLLGFICKGCGMNYVSIADRKLRPPGIEGCNGCQLRSAHG